MENYFIPGEFATAVVRGIAVKGDQSLECMDQNKCNYVKNMVFPN